MKKTLISIVIAAIALSAAAYSFFVFFPQNEKDNWIDIAHSTDSRSYQKYLEKYPKGAYAELARMKFNIYTYRDIMKRYADIKDIKYKGTITTSVIDRGFGSSFQSRQSINRPDNSTEYILQFSATSLIDTALNSKNSKPLQIVKLPYLSIGRYDIFEIEGFTIEKVSDNFQKAMDEYLDFYKKNPSNPVLRSDSLINLSNALALIMEAKKIQGNYFSGDNGKKISESLMVVENLKLITRDSTMAAKPGLWD